MKKWWDDAFMDLDNRIGKVFNRMLKVYLIMIGFFSAASSYVFIHILPVTTTGEFFLKLSCAMVAWTLVIILSVTLLVKHEEKEFWLKQIRSLVGDILEIIEGGTSGKSNS